MNEVKILKATGYDDGYYWDYRINFEYDGYRFEYINVGSFSTYIPNHREIMVLTGGEEFLEGPRDPRWLDSSPVYEEDPGILKHYAELCLANDGEYIIPEEDYYERYL